MTDEDLEIAEIRRKRKRLDRYGKTPATRPGLKPVPEAAIGLPWSRRPRDPQTCNALAAIFEHMATTAPVKQLGPDAVACVEAEAKILRVLAERLKA